MGVAYWARQVSPPRDVAVAMLINGSFAEAGERTRFEREANLIASLHHPEIVQVYDFEATGDFPFVVMECCPGGSLAEKLASGRLNPSEATTILIEPADAVGAAHRKDIIHRDLKPSNLLFGDDGRLKVADFGLATRHTPDNRDTADRRPLVTRGLHEQDREPRTT